MPIPDNLKIAVVTSPLVEGGIATHLKELVPRLRRHGHVVTLITSADYEKAVEADEVKTYQRWTTTRILKQYGFVPQAMRSIFSVLGDCDVVHIHGYPHFLADYLTFTQPIHKKPLVITMHGSLHQFAGFRVRLLKNLHNVVMLRFDGFVDRFIAVSQAEKEEITRRGIPERKVEVIYNGVSDFPDVSGNHVRGQSKTKNVLYLGRLTGTKNPELLVQAMSHSIKQGGNIKLVMAGADWGEQGKLERMVATLGMNSSVEFIGEVNEEQKAKLFATADVFVHPSLQDIFAISILEASMAGLPTVAFNVGGNAEMIINGRTGVLVDELRPEAMSAAIMKVLSNGDSARKMGEEARKYVSGKFSWAAAANHLEQLYRSVLETRRA